MTDQDTNTDTDMDDVEEEGERTAGETGDTH